MSNEKIRKTRKKLPFFQKNNVIVLSQKQAKDLFGSDASIGIGKGIKIKGELFEVIGIKDDSNDDLTGNSSYIPKFSKELIDKKETISSIDITVEKGYDKKVVFKDIKRELEHIHSDLKGGYKQENQNEAIKSLQKIINGITGFITIVTGISLFVGGIGVMNIMYVSVSERRKEIGIRRAIGAKKGVILLQFLVEAIFITTLGGGFGIALGYSLSRFIGIFLPVQPILTANVFIGSTLTSMIIGITFGIIPAIKASKLSPIEAIRR